MARQVVAYHGSAAPSRTILDLGRSTWDTGTISEYERS